MALALLIDYQGSEGTQACLDPILRGRGFLEDLKTLVTFAAPYRRRLILIGLLMLANSGATLAVPWVLGHLAGDLISGGATDMSELVGILLVILTVVALLSATLRYLSGETAWRILADLQLRIYNRLQSLPIGFHQAGRQGNTLALITREVPYLSEFLTNTLVSIPPLLVTTLGAMVLMFRIDPTLALAVPLLVPGFYLTLKLIGRRLRKLARELQQAEADFVGIAEQNLEMLPAIKMFTREQLASAQYQDHINLSMALSLKINRIYAVVEPLVGLVAAAAIVLLLVLAGQNLEDGSMTPGQLLSFLFYAALLARPVGKLANVYGQVNTARGTLQRMREVFAQEPEHGYAVETRLPKVHGEIEFRGVSFSYPGRAPLLRALDVTIEAGETVALTGLNGAGKSTFVALLLRMHEPYSGSIQIDGKDIASLNVQDVRRQIGVVPQDISLFNATIRENIAFGQPMTSEADILAAAREANALGFIERLPQGFDTGIGDHGSRLSGGQRQRIALARALLKDPPILILDEANSMYDEEGEGAFVEFCARSTKHRTLILITHRSTSQGIVDRVLRLEAGKLIDERSLADQGQD